MQKLSANLCVSKSNSTFGLLFVKRRSMAPNKPMTKGMQVWGFTKNAVDTVFSLIRRWFKKLNHVAVILKSRFFGEKHISLGISYLSDIVSVVLLHPHPGFLHEAWMSVCDAQEVCKLKVFW